jgi:hypothetical protein
MPALYVLVQIEMGLCIDATKKRREHPNKTNLNRP